MAICQISGWSGTNRILKLTVTPNQLIKASKIAIIDWVLEAVGDVGVDLETSVICRVNNQLVCDYADYAVAGTIRSSSLQIQLDSDGKANVPFSIQGYVKQPSTKTASNTLALDYSSEYNPPEPEGVMRVIVNGTWKEAVPYVLVNGVWKEAVAYVKNNNAWRQGT